MQCPGCNGVMTTQALNGTQVEVCSTCAGMWFDEAEISRVLKGDQVKVFAFDEEFRPLAKPTNLDQKKCPKCDCVMTTMGYQYSGPIKIDTCDQCAGVFLEDGELASIEKFDDSRYVEDPKANAAFLAGKLETDAKQAKVKAFFFVRNALIRRRSSFGFVLEKDTELPDYPK